VVAVLLCKLVGLSQVLIAVLRPWCFDQGKHVVEWCAE
jgi:hypothetical protein